jgi:hypothetical protein
VFSLGSVVFNKTKSFLKSVSVFALKVASNTFGQEIKQDDFGQINVLVL